MRDGNTYRATAKSKANGPVPRSLAMKAARNPGESRRDFDRRLGAALKARRAEQMENDKALLAKEITGVTAFNVLADVKP